MNPFRSSEQTREGACGIRRSLATRTVGSRLPSRPRPMGTARRPRAVTVHSKSCPHTYVAGHWQQWQGPRWGGGGGRPTFRPKVQGGVGGGDYEGPPLGGYLGKVPSGRPTLPFQMAFTTAGGGRWPEPAASRSRGSKLNMPLTSSQPTPAPHRRPRPRRHRASDDAILVQVPATRRINCQSRSVASKCKRDCTSSSPRRAGGADTSSPGETESCL